MPERSARERAQRLGLTVAAAAALIGAPAVQDSVVKAQGSAQESSQSTGVDLASLAAPEGMDHSALSVVARRVIDDVEQSGSVAAAGFKSFL